MDDRVTLSGKERDRRSLSSFLPFSEPRLSRIILAATGVTGFLIVLLWLVVSALIAMPRGPDNLLDISVATVGGIGRSEPLENEVRAFLERTVDKAAVVVLHGLAASRPHDQTESGAYLVTLPDKSEPLPVSISLSAIIRDLRDHSRRAPTMLILDCSVDAADRSLGLYGNNFIGELQSLVQRSPDPNEQLAVLAACDSGQLTWGCEGSDGSVFIHYVEEFFRQLPGKRGRFTASALHRYVQQAVAQWVDANRHAVQTPILLGREDVTLRLTSSLGMTSRNPDRLNQVSPLENEIFDEWHEQQRLIADTPSPRRHAPIAWRRYQDALLRSERLLRAGDETAVKSVLADARQHRKNVETQLKGPPLSDPWSLALLRKTAGSPDRNARAAECETAIDRWFAALSPETGASVKNTAIAQSRDAAGTYAGGAKKPRDDAAKTKPSGEDPPKSSEEIPDGEPANARRAVYSAASPATLVFGPLTRPGGKPAYVEGQLPVWFESFSSRGGDTEQWRSDRLGLLRKAIDARKQAEEIAARDLHLSGVVRSLIEHGDKHRRKAQDCLFASDRTSLERCDPELTRAREFYTRAHKDADDRAVAFDLLHELQDTLPYYGEWIVRTSGRVGLVEEFTTRGTELADQLLRDASKSSPDEGGQNPLAGVSKLRRDFDEQIKADFKRRATDVEQDDWRQIDGLLRVPDIEPNTRRALLRRARELSSFTNPDSSVKFPVQPKADDKFFTLALGLTRLECYLRRIAGLMTSDLEIELGHTRHDVEAEKHLEAEKRVTPAAFDPISDLLRKSLSRAVTNTQGSADKVESLAHNDRVARAAIGGDLWVPSANVDPPWRMDEFDAQSLTLWNAERLLDDFDVEASRRLLDTLNHSPMHESNRREWNRIFELANTRAKSELKVTAKVDTTRVPRASVSVAREGSFPADGQAALLFAHEQPATVNASPTTSNLIAIDSASSIPVDFGLENWGALIAKLTPCAFFRGRFYSTQAQEFPLPSTAWVKVEIHQAKREITDVFVNRRGRIGKATLQIPDQFEKRQDRGYLHLNTNLDYKLKVTNLTEKPLDVFIAQDLAGSKSGQAISLQRNEANETITGTLRGVLFKDRKEKTLQVKVLEGQAEGKSLCRPLKVVFEAVDPKDYIKWDLYFGGEEGATNRITLVLAHSDQDEVPFPIDVVAAFEPTESFSQRTKYPFAIRRGQKVTRVWEIVRETGRYKFTLKINNETLPPKEGNLKDLSREKPKDQGDVPKNLPEDAGAAAKDVPDQ